jgi:hypothetical protein
MEVVRKALSQENIWMEHNEGKKLQSYAIRIYIYSFMLENLSNSERGVSYLIVLIDETCFKHIVLFHRMTCKPSIWIEKLKSTIILLSFCEKSLLSMIFYRNKSLFIIKVSPILFLILITNNTQRFSAIKLDQMSNSLGAQSPYSAIFPFTVIKNMQMLL